MKMMARELAALVKCSLLWIATIVGGTLLTLILSIMIGYLPYSDRPGPGWGPSRSPALSELNFFANWAIPFLIPSLAFWGICLFVLVRSLGYLNAPVAFIRIVGGLLGGILCLIVMAASGWYIALAPEPIYAASILGIIFGATMLPRFRGAAGTKVPGSIRILGITVVTLGFASAIIYPFWPRTPIPQLQVHVMRLVLGDQPITRMSGLEENEIQTLGSLGLRGTFHGGIQSYSGSGAKHVRMLIIATGPIKSAVQLRQPKESDVIYVQTGDNWDAYPHGISLTNNKVVLRPSETADKDLDLRVDDGGSGWSSFSWSPPIRDR